MNISTDNLMKEQGEYPGGQLIGESASSLIAFHGATPAAQRAGAAQAAVVTTAAATGSYGFTEAQANAIVTLLNEMRAVLVEKGIMKGEA